ncbi:MAG TPA: hypothetical protein VEC14_13450 [Reyranellaceae bacterium]|nr:hypothetical protein [Reyranellaceae bacterium]
MFRRLLFCLLAVACTAHAQMPGDDNEFSTQTPAEFMTVPPEKDFDAAGIFAARGIFTAALQLDNVLSPGPNYRPFGNLFAESELRGYVAITEYFTLNGLVKLEQARDQLQGGAFVDQSLYIQRLFGVINLAPFHLYGGKIHPRFGIGWFHTPGLYGTDFAEEYELNERLGFGLRIDLRGEFGSHRLTVEAFQADTSFLNGNAFAGSVQLGDPGVKRQGRRSLADGGVSNTGTFESFAVALSSRRWPGLEGLGTEVGFFKQRASPFDLRDEHAWTASAFWRLPLGGDLSIEPMAEFASVSGQAGTDRNVDYLTLAANLRIGEVWAVALHTSQKYVRDFALADFRTDWLAGFAVACDLGEAFKELPFLAGVTAVAGYRYDRRAGVERNTLGFLLKYEKAF